MVLLTPMPAMSAARDVSAISSICHALHASVLFMHRNPYKELCTGRRLIKSSIYNSALQGKQLLILAEADIADRNMHVYALGQQARMLCPLNRCKNCLGLCLVTGCPLCCLQNCFSKLLTGHVVLTKCTLVQGLSHNTCPRRFNTICDLGKVPQLHAKTGQPATPAIFT
jgi:hypothetical protein